MATERMCLTATLVRELSPHSEGNKRRYVYDTKMPHLALCITGTDARIYYRCGRVDGKPTRIRLGTTHELSVEQARRACAELTSQIAVGKNPQAQKQAKRHEPTVGDLWRQYLEFHAKPHRRRWKRDERLYRRDIAQWESRRISSLTAQEISRYMQATKESRGVSAANWVLKLLRGMFSVADQIGYEGPSPVAKLRMFRETSRERYLRPDEMPAFWRAVDEIKSPISRAFIRLCLFTGARRSNVGSMRWDELDLDRATWTIPSSKHKNGKPVTIALPPPAVELLKELKASSKGSPWVLPSTRSRTGHFTDPKNTIRRIRKLAGLDDLRVHDLRRTMGSWQAAAGASALVIGRSLGHSDIRSTAIYARLDLEPVRTSVSVAAEAMIAAGQKKT